MSRFVSAGTNEEPAERDDEWLRAQQEIEANRLKKLDEGRQEGGKSLYEVLQANKDAKQEAFEEKIKLKNQFRALDDDEVDFLDSVLESTRAQEAALRKETTEQLEAFRKQQGEVEKAVLDDGGEPALAGEQEQWVPKARKRRRSAAKGDILGVKIRRTSSANLAAKPAPVEKNPKAVAHADATDPVKGLPSERKAVVKHHGEDPGGAEAKNALPPTATLGLGAYSSDDSQD